MNIHTINGGLSVDDRGVLSFVNDFTFEGVKRFYVVENHEKGFVRAWHGHKREAKYVHCVSGSAILSAVKIDNWEKPSVDTEIHRLVISEKKPSVVYIPAGFANGFKTLEENTKIIFFSSSTLAESQGDDYRFDADYWNPWNIVPR